MARGLYRGADGWVMVGFGANALPMERRIYEEEGHTPPYDALPTEEEFKASGGTLDVHLKIPEGRGSSFGG